MANSQAEIRKALKAIEKARAQRRKSFEGLTNEQQKAILGTLRATESILECARCLVSFSYEDLIKLERDSGNLAYCFGIIIEEE